jgi:uncharacterized protein YjdB
MKKYMKNNLNSSSKIAVAVLLLSLFSPLSALAAPIASIDASQLNNNITVGTTYSMSALALDATGWPVSPQPTFAWASSDPAVATISPAGLFNALAVGVTTITVTDVVSGLSGTVLMTVSPVIVPALTSIYVNPTTAIVTVGATKQFSATAYDQMGMNPMNPQPAFAWASSNAAVGTIDGAGLFTAIAPGTTVISASSGVITGTSAMTVVSVGGPTFGSISISNVNGGSAFGANIPLGYTVQLQATAWDASGFNKVSPQPVFTWTSSNAAVATIDATGLFTAVGLGTVTITASSQGVSHSINTIVGEGFTLTSSVGVNGAISPLGTTVVAPGANQTFTITPNAGYSVANVLVDNVSIGAVTTYTFTNVLTSHTISATFTPTPVIVANLVAGWNLIGWTNVPITAEALGLANAGVDLVSKWDATTQLWVSHIINFPLNNFTINPGDGVFVHKI